MTNEQLEALRALVADDAMFGAGNVSYPLPRELMVNIIAHVDAQAARIAKLEENAAAHALAMKAAKAMQQAETERSDKAEAKVDSLMLEFCPDEMTNEQIERWSRSQVVAPRPWPEDVSDYGSRIATIGQNGNDGLHYCPPCNGNCNQGRNCPARGKK